MSSREVTTECLPMAHVSCWALERFSSWWLGFETDRDKIVQISNWQQPVNGLSLSVYCDRISTTCQVSERGVYLAACCQSFPRFINYLHKIPALGLKVTFAPGGDMGIPRYLWFVEDSRLAPSVEWLWHFWEGVIINTCDVGNGWEGCRKGCRELGALEWVCTVGVLA